MESAAFNYYVIDYISNNVAVINCFVRMKCLDGELKVRLTANAFGWCSIACYLL